MKHFLYALLSLFAALLLMGFAYTPTGTAPAPAPATLDSLLDVLDRIIDDKPVYDARKRAEIAHISVKLDATTSPQATFDALRELFDAYKCYSMDSALTVAYCARKYADIIATDSVRWRSMLMAAEALKGMGDYSASLLTLDSLPPQAYDLYAEDIFVRYGSVYYSLLENTAYPPDRQRYLNKLISYRDTLTKISRSPSGRLINAMELAKLRDDHEAAIAMFDASLSAGEIPAVEAPMFNYVLAQAYAARGDTITAEALLAQAAIDDISSSIRKYVALPELAIMLYRTGRYDRAFDYIIFALDDIRASHSQSRLTRVVEALPIITQAYKDQSRQASHRQTILVASLIVLALLLIAAGLMLVRKNRHLTAEHRTLQEYNHELSEIKASLHTSNTALDHSNTVKEEYIGQLFNLCSEYIDLMTTQHAGILKAVKSRNIEAVEKAASQLRSPDRLRHFFEKFDQTFLAIFPNYVETFNSMLHEQYREVPAPDTLTPEMRIFALMRLGITDTAAIAGFLHYSPHTVYNYRFRLKTRANVDIDTFTAAILAM